MTLGAQKTDLEVLEEVLPFTIKRQVQGRPTTLRQMSKRVAVPIENVVFALDKYQVNYALLNYPGSKKNSYMHTEVLLREVPKEIAERIGVASFDLEESFENIIADWKKTGGENGSPESKESLAKAKIVRKDEADPYARYRITQEQYEVLKKQLITYQELEQYARAKGYNPAAIYRAVGGDRMRYTPVGEFWRPYVVSGKRYYLKEVLKHLSESDLTYKSELLREKKRKIRKQRRRTNFAKNIHNQSESLEKENV